MPPTSMWFRDRTIRYDLQGMREGGRLEGPPQHIGHPPTVRAIPEFDLPREAMGRPPSTTRTFRSTFTHPIARWSFDGLVSQEEKR